MKIESVLKILEGQLEVRLESILKIWIFNKGPLGMHTSSCPCNICRMEKESFLKVLEGQLDMRLESVLKILQGPLDVQGQEWKSIIESFEGHLYKNLYRTRKYSPLNRGLPQKRALARVSEKNTYRVATISRLLKIIRLFCRILSLL